MESALLSVLSFATIILLGIAAARFSLIGKSADKLISTIVFKLTLPATIIHAFGTTEVAPAMLGIVLVGFACAAIPYAIAFFVTRHMDACDRPLFLFGAGGMNIGCFLTTYFIGAVGNITGNADPRLPVQYGFAIVLVAGIIWAIIEAARKRKMAD